MMFYDCNKYEIITILFRFVCDFCSALGWKLGGRDLRTRTQQWEKRRIEIKVNVWKPDEMNIDQPRLLSLTTITEYIECWKEKWLRINLKVHVLNFVCDDFERSNQFAFSQKFSSILSSKIIITSSFIYIHRHFNTESKRYRRESFLFVTSFYNKKTKYIWAWVFRLLLMTRNNRRFTLFIISFSL